MLEYYANLYMNAKTGNLVIGFSYYKIPFDEYDQWVLIGIFN